LGIALWHTSLNHNTELNKKLSYRSQTARRV